jgi:hypothetical protein
MVIDLACCGLEAELYMLHHARIRLLPPTFLHIRSDLSKQRTYTIACATRAAATSVLYTINCHQALAAPTRDSRRDALLECDWQYSAWPRVCSCNKTESLEH